VRGAGAPRLWLPPQRALQLLAGRQHTLRRLDDLIARLRETLAGFAALPLDEQLAECAPPAVEWGMPAP
jgi:hypothetical protein